MYTSLTRRVAPVIFSLGLTGGIVGNSAVGASTVPRAYTAKGTVKTLNVPKDQLTVKVGKKTDTVLTTETTAITVGGKTTTLSKLKPGETLTIRYKFSGKRWIAISIAAKS